MNMIITATATEHTIEIDGTKFDIPADQTQRHGLRELVVNYFCRAKGYPALYPETNIQN